MPVEQKINAELDIPAYGIVSDGTWWQFGVLVGDAFTQNRTSFSLDDVPTLFGAVHAVFKAAGAAPKDTSLQYACLLNLSHKKFSYVYTCLYVSRKLALEILTWVQILRKVEPLMRR